MSPNNNHLLNSYQHDHCSSEHEPLSIDDNFDQVEEGGVGAGGIDIGIMSKPSRNSSNADAEESSMFTEHLQNRAASHRTKLLLVSVLCSFGIGWFASSLFSISGRASGHSPAKEDGDVIEQPDVVAPESTNSIPDLIWSDEFDGDAVDLTKWTFVNGNGCDIGLCGWGNNELEWYTPSNAHVSDGILTIQASKLFLTPGGPPSYTTSKIISRGKADFGVVDTKVSETSNLEKTRRFEASLKLPWGVGIWPAFWMLPTYDTYGGWPKSGEIDIMENIGKEGPNTVHGTVHYGLQWPQHQYSEAGITLSSHSTSPFGNLNETFHSYAVERLPGIIRWYIDDVEYSSITKEEMEPYHWPFDDEFYFIFNLAVGGNWPGNPLDEDGEDGDATVFPQTLQIDYVRVYEGVFPRIVGTSVVDCSETNVVYEVTNVAQEQGITYTWTVPKHAIIIEGQGTHRTLVRFNFPMAEGAIYDDAIIHVQTNGIDENDQSRVFSAGLSKLQDPGVGIRVKVTNFDGKCSATAKSKPSEKRFNFDCGRPSTCTEYVLHRTTDEFTCGERIEWLMNDGGMNERDACHEVGYLQFHGHCHPCNPTN